MQKREFLHKGHTFDTMKHSIGGWFWSEKLDGMRCFWDGGITRGLPVEEIPFANLSSNGIRLDKQFATGLWSFYAHPIQAPDWFLDKLPEHCLDGEVYLGRGRFEETVSIVKRLVPDERWKSIKYIVFDAPSLPAVFQTGEVNNPNYKMVFNTETAIWALDRSKKVLPIRQFASTVKFLEMFLPQNEVVVLHKQEILPYSQSGAIDFVKTKFEEIVGQKGEGLILRSQSSLWCPKRNWCTLKVKGKLDAEGTILGYTAGEVGKTGKLHGLIGAIIVNFGGKVFELAGLTDDERAFTAAGKDWALNNPGKEAPSNIEAVNFKRGEVITFTYESLTADGKPRSARYLRKRID